MSKRIKASKGELAKHGPERWLILTQYYPPEVGAPQIRLRCLARQLRREGKAVSVLTALPNYPVGRIFDAYRGRFSCREQIDGIDVRRTWVYAATGKAASARFLNYCSFALTALAVILFRRRPDVLFVEAQPLPLGIVALFMKHLRGVRYVYNVPDLQVDVARELGFIRRPSVLRLAQFAEDLFLKNAWKVSTVTHHFMRHFESRGVPAERVTFLPNGADTDFLRRCEPSGDYLTEWDLHGKKVFVYVGTHAYYHGLDTLVAAAEILRGDQCIRIVMVGDGPERERIRSLAREKGLDNMIFVQAPYDKSALVYSVAWAALATLRNVPVAKGMRLSKIFPALSCGVPVIYSGVGEAADLLSAHNCGLTVPPEDATALAHAMESLAYNPGLREQLGSNGEQLVAREYSWETIVHRWLGEIEKTELATDSRTFHTV